MTESKEGYIFYVFVKAKDADEALKNFWKDINKRGSKDFSIRTCLRFDHAQKIMEHAKKYDKIMEILGEIIDDRK